VNKAALTVTANNASKTYGDTVTFAGTEFTTAGLKNTDTVTSATLTSVGAGATATVAGSPYSIDASNATGSGLGNYNISYVSGQLTVNKAALTVTANNASKTYGDTVSFAGTEFTTAGLKNGQTIGSVTLASNGAPASAAIGSYAITPSNATGGTFDPANYQISYVNGVLMVITAAANPNTPPSHFVGWSEPRGVALRDDVTITFQTPTCGKRRGARGCPTSDLRVLPPPRRTMMR